MAEPHPTASHYLPLFITAPGGTDVLTIVMGLFLALVVAMFGVLFLRLHSLPDQIAHKSHKLQSEIVGVLCLIALFTHIHGNLEQYRFSSPWAPAEFQIELG